MTVSSDLIEEIRRIVGTAGIRRHSLERRLFAKDAGMFRGNGPDLVVLPTDTAQAGTVVGIASRHRVPVFSRGSGTGLAGGAVPEGGILVATTRLDRILGVDPEAGTAWIEPGVLNLDLSRHCARWGLHFAPDPASQAACTIGGNVAVNAGGPHGLAAGSTTEHVLAVELVTGDGTPILMGGPAPDPTGLDLRAVVIGSEGTMGLVTRILVRLTANPPAVRTLLLGFDSVEDAVAAVSAMVESGLVPAALELMDRRLVELVERFAGGGYPTAARAVLLAEVAGNTAAVETEAGAIAATARNHGASSVRLAAGEEERATLWKGRRAALGALAQIAPNYYIHDIVVPRARLPEVVARFDEIAQRHRLDLVVFGHAGDGNLHPTFAFDAAAAEQVERVEAAGAEILAVSVESGGVLSGEHGIGREKRRFMPLCFAPADLDVQRRVKDAFDPDRIFNPGKVLPAETGYREPLRTVGRSELGDLVERLGIDHPAGAPAAEMALGPRTPEDVARILEAASALGLVVLPWGGGTHQGLGGRLTPDIVLSTHLLDYLAVWRPEDLVVVVEAGMRVADLERRLGERLQTALLPESPGSATVGGVVAAGVSGWRRLRFGPVRDRVLEAVLCTGDGRIIRSGAPLVKNATGYDLARLGSGSLGALGVLTRIALRLWPRPEAEATVRVADPDAARRRVHRPLAAVEADGEARIYLGGTAAEVAEQVDALGGDAEAGHRWPAPLDAAIRLSLRVPAPETRGAVDRLPATASYRAAFGVGEIAIGIDTWDGVDLEVLRAWAEQRRGSLVLTAGPPELYERFDPWGTPPDSLALQRRVKQAFDPAGIMVPGRLPGGL